jgi:hypothetical protein
MASKPEEQEIPKRKRGNDGSSSGSSSEDFEIVHKEVFQCSSEDFEIIHKEDYRYDSSSGEDMYDEGYDVCNYIVIYLRTLEQLHRRL